MVADFDKPTVDDEYTNILPDIRELTKSLALMFSQGNEQNIPVSSIRFINNQFSKFNGATFDVQAISIGGGGTGSTSAAGARSALGTDNASNVTTGIFDAARIPVLSITSKTSGDLPLTRTSGILSGTKVDQANTSQRGTVELNDTLTSSSTTEALTANQGKSLKDTADSLSNTVAAITNNSSITATGPAPAGQVDGGSCEISRSGSVVVISGEFTHPSLTQATTATGAIQAEFRPSQNSENVYTFIPGSSIQKATVTTTGEIIFDYVDFSGSATSKMITGKFTISYSIE